MKRTTTYMTLLLFLAICLLGGSAIAAPKRFIEVSAQAQLEVDPDVVDLRFTLNSKEKTPSLAVKSIVAKEKAVLAALKKAGMPATEVQISYLSLRPNMKYVKSSFSGNRYVLDGYKASKTFVACVRNIGKMAHFVEALAGASVTSFSTAFRSTKVATHKKKLRKMAVMAARAKAAELATHSGVKVGAVKFIREHQPGSGRVYSNSFAYSRRRGTKGARPGAVTLRLQVRMAFFIK